MRAPEAEQMTRAGKHIHGRLSGGCEASRIGARGAEGFTQCCCGNAESRRTGRPKAAAARGRAGGGPADRAAPCGLSPARPRRLRCSLRAATRGARPAQPGSAAAPPLSPRGGTIASTGPARSHFSAAFCFVAVYRLLLAGPEDAGPGGRCVPAAEHRRLGRVRRREEECGSRNEHEHREWRGRGEQCPSLGAARPRAGAALGEAPSRGDSPGGFSHLPADSPLLQPLAPKASTASFSTPPSRSVLARCCLYLIFLSFFF